MEDVSSCVSIREGLTIACATMAIYLGLMEDSAQVMMVPWCATGHVALELAGFHTNVSCVYDCMMLMSIVWFFRCE